MRSGTLVPVWLSLALSCGSMARIASAQTSAPVLALQYDFSMNEGDRTADASGNGHDGQLVNATIAEGRLRNAVDLAGNGAVRMASIPATIDPRSRPLTVGALCQPSALDGVLVAMGDSTNGFSLYIEAGVPRFAVRSGGELHVVAGSEPVSAGQWVHLAGAIDVDGTVYLLVNAWPVASTPGGLVAATPVEPLAVGTDEGLPVARYAAGLPWTGLVQDVRLYRGYLDRTEDGRFAWQTWADLPSCACKPGSTGGSR